MEAAAQQKVVPDEFEANRDDELKLLNSYLMGVPDRTRAPKFSSLNIDVERGRYVVIELVSEKHITPERPSGLDELVEISASGLPGHVFWICYSRAGIAQAALDELSAQLTCADSAGMSLPCRDLDRLYVARRQAQVARRDHTLGVRGMVSIYASSGEEDAFDTTPWERMLLALECGDREWFARLAMSYCNRMCASRLERQSAHACAATTVCTGFGAHCAVVGWGTADTVSVCTTCVSAQRATPTFHKY